MPPGEYTLTDLEYTNDTTLFVETESEPQDALTIFDDEAKMLGLRINWPKTEPMHVGAVLTHLFFSLKAPLSTLFHHSNVLAGSEMEYDGGGGQTDIAG